MRRVFQAAFLMGALAVSLTGPSSLPAAGVGQWRCNETQRSELLVVVDCNPGFATEYDRVLIYSRPGSAMAGKPGVLDSTNAVWLFFPGARDDAKLAIDFHPSDRGLVAELYDDRKGRGRLGYVLRHGVPAITDLLYPTLRFLAPEGWWERDGLVNYNLEIEVFGDVLASFGAETVIDRFRDNLLHYSIHVNDENHNGAPESETIQVSPRVRIPGSFVRSQAFLNTAHNEFPISGSVLWPYLGHISYAGYDTIQELREETRLPCTVVKDYRRSAPPVQMDWVNGRIACLGEFVASRFNEHNWFIYSIERQGEPASRPANWETFGFYDLANDHDGIPELIVRVLNWNADDPYADIRSRSPQNFVRYSWDQRAGAKDRADSTYKVDLGGAHQITTTVDVHGLRLKAIPYADLPYWVTDREWGVAAFVAVEEGPYNSSEGIYEWDSAEPEWRYLAGHADSDESSVTYANIHKGLRGEYRVGEDKPWLYFSPIDRKLHLLRAQGGVWNVDGRIEVRNANLGGGDYINQWRVEREGDLDSELISSLTFAAGQLVLATPSGIQLRAVDAPPALFTTLPPRNHEEWAHLGSLLGKHAGAFTGTDLKAMFDQFPAPAQTLPSTTIRDVRVTPDGFRFVAELSQQASGVPWAAGLSPGSYLVRYRPSGGYSAEPLAPPALEMSPLALAHDGLQATALDPIEVSVEVRNRGGADARPVAVSFKASRAGGDVIPLGSVVTAVPGEASARARLTWAPPNRGDWTVEATTADWNGAGAREELRVAPAPGTDLGAILAPQALATRTWIAVGSLFLALALASGSLALAAWRTSPGVDRGTAGPGDSRA